MKNIIRPKICPSIIGHAAAVGKKEHEGPLGNLFDYHDASDRFGQKTWELSEGEMQHIALNLALSKSKMPADSLGALFAGDLINQCTSSSYGLLDINVPFFGLYGACSTSAEGLILATLWLNSTENGSAAVVTSSHNCSAERQFRFPVEYGGIRTPTSQWTVTGAAAFILGEGHGAYITELLPGISVDRGITDPNNMGAAMAPAAYETLRAHFADTGRTPADYAAIITGDLGKIGHEILTDLFLRDGVDLGVCSTDCGMLIFNPETQDVHAGGSGCGCSASVLCGHILQRMTCGDWPRVLFAATGALMSPTTSQQGESIPGICHAVVLDVDKG